MERRYSRPTSEQLHARASRYLPGGVSSDVRLGGPPLFFQRGEGAYLYDVDGDRYVDYVLGMGALVLGHSHPAVVQALQEQAARGLVFGGQHELEPQVAELIHAAVPSAQALRFNSVGSEATHAAIRLARAFTGRQKIIKFEGHYHGWLDGVLYSTSYDPARSGPRERPATVAGSGGMAQSAAGDVLVAPWNNLQVLEEIMREHEGSVAAVIMEPYMCNTGCILPLPGYLEGVQQLCRRHGALLIFDEVITGFRVALGGAQAQTGVVPDISTFGKAVGGGMPVSVVAGRADVFQLITQRKVVHAGTFNSNPLALAGARAALTVLSQGGDTLYRELAKTGQQLAAGLAELGRRFGVPLQAVGPGPLFQVYFSENQDIRDARDVAATDIQARNRFVAAMLDEGVRITSRGLFFLSTAHGEREIALTLEAAQRVLRRW